MNNKLQAEILRFLEHYPGLYTVTMIAEAIDRAPTTTLRTALDVLYASGAIVRQVVATEANRLAWGYTLPKFAKRMKGF